MSRTLAEAPMRLHVRLSMPRSLPPARLSPLQSRLWHSSGSLDLEIRLVRSHHNGALPDTPRILACNVRVCPARRYSTAPKGPAADNGNVTPRPRNTPQGRVPFLRLLRMAFTPFRGQTWRDLYQKNPEELVLALAVLVAVVLVLLYVARIYYTYFYSRQFTRYPAPVAKYLRRALYFSNYSPDPKRALKNYKLALEQCDMLGLDPFSDDVLGIRIQLVAWLEQVQNYEAAIKILELLRSDCLRWVETMESSVADGSATAGAAGSVALFGRLPPPQLTGRAAAEQEVREGGPPTAAPESIWGRRSRLLQKAIGISVKLGDLYADEHVLDAQLAHERLVWSVDAALKEFRRRAKDGARADEGAWMSPKEMGAALESLGHSYESRAQFQLALPLFFQALRLCDDPCHSAVIMNNLAVCFAQHPLQPPYDTLAGSPIDASAGEAITHEEAKQAYLEAAQRWATNAHHHASDTKDDARSGECDEACVVSLCNLGDIAAMMGNVAEARRRFQQGRAMSEKLQFVPGVEQAEAGLRRLT